MTSMKADLPPMDTLASFEAAARLQSFTLAAKELHITQAAVSRQMRLLEDSLKTPLFHRAHRSVSLTTRGKEFYSTITLALTHIANATRSLRDNPKSQQITIVADQSIAWLWLMPRLARFRECFPGVDVRLIVSDHKADYVADDVDIALTFGPGHWPGFNHILLFEEEIFPVCSPAYLQERQDVLAYEGADLNDLLKTGTLLDLEDDQWGWVNWQVWMTEMGLSHLPTNNAININNYPLVLESARNGMGFALGWKHLVDELLEKGELVRPFERYYRSDKGYYLLTRKMGTANEGIIGFRNWVCNQFSRG
ncbi:MAG: LysR family transcriptional regulator [Gammaproteobacteria bacterium]|nr:LysR family transcriptional regulator [Gammaproteobacteria bacterium]